MSIGHPKLAKYSLFAQTRAGGAVQVSPEQEAVLENGATGRVTGTTRARERIGRCNYEFGIAVFVPVLHNTFSQTLNLIPKCVVSILRIRSRTIDSALSNKPAEHKFENMIHNSAKTS